MILADKIVSLRKKSGWSQEELAEKLGVSRQAVSKWEGAQSVPDLDRILQMSRVFGVTTDYLVKDELGEPEYTKDDEETQPPVRRVSLEEANAYLAAKEKTAKPTAWAVFLCIVSPVCLVLLSAAAEAGRLALTEDSAALIGLCVLFGLIAGAVAIFISCDERTKRFAHLERECFETEYGVTGMVRERQSRFAPTAAKYNILGVVLCILSVVPLFLCSILPNDDFLSAVGVGLLLCCIGLGTVLLVLAGERTASFDQLLQEGDYTSRKKERASKSVLQAVYWPCVTAAFLAYSFITSDWGRSWIIWPVAGVLSAALDAIEGAVKKKKK